MKRGNLYAEQDQMSRFSGGPPDPTTSFAQPTLWAPADEVGRPALRMSAAQVLKEVVGGGEVGRRIFAATRRRDG